MSDGEGGSFLPKWVRDFRESINKSRINYDSSILKIENLKSDLKIFDEIYLKGRDVAGSSPPIVLAAIASETTETSVNESSNCVEVKSYLPLLPNELLLLILDYILVNDVLTMEKTSICLKQRISELNVYWWKLYVISMYGSMHQSANEISLFNSSINHRTAVLDREKDKRFILYFIDKIKQDRSMKRTDDSRPRTYSKNDKSVTHYLPFSDHDGQLMSNAETFAPDFRTLALKSLNLLNNLTANSSDLFIRTLIETGVVTVCVSLLSNEHTVLQEYSCSIIANLLVWECRGRNPDWLQKSVYKFFKNLNGIKILCSKLTSPNACVKLWNSSGDSNQKLVAGIRTSQTSSQVISVYSKEASRALVNLFSPMFPIPPLENNDTNINHILNDRVTTWTFRYYHKSGALKDIYDCKLYFSSDGIVRGRGIDSIQPFILIGNCDLDISGFYWNVKKCYVRIDGSEDIWLSSPDEEYVTNGKLKPHISHTFYYSNNKYDKAGPYIPIFESEEEEFHSNVGEQVVDSTTVADNFGIGFFGVWEAISDNQSFILNKGGVFRATTSSI